LLTYSRPVIEEMEAPELERRLVAILAADVECYSRLMHADEEATMSTLSARRLLIDNLISDHRRGRIANTAGDSWRSSPALSTRHVRSRSKRPWMKRMRPNRAIQCGSASALMPAAS
jgi:class 3 adenylate cyclase